jgi:hypothetical protein
VTAKPEPDDIDLTLVIEGVVFDLLDPAIQADLANIGDGRFAPALHVFVAVTRERGHPDHPMSQMMIDYWAQWWGVTREDWIKGMPVVRIGETDVGLRLFP